VEHGIVDLLHDPPDFVCREAAGLSRFAAVMRRDGWGREQMLALPDVDLGYWWAQKEGLRAVLAAVEPKEGCRLLDVGANTCWASNLLAQRGLEVVALDITDVELQGLRTADYFLERDEIYFERLKSVMFDMALASGCMDYVLCCEVLHHNSVSNLRRTMRELYRVLRPGGALLVINEPLRFPLNFKRQHAHEVAEFDGYEHVFFFHQYYLAALRAGFSVVLQEPVTEAFFTDWAATLAPQTSIYDALKAFVAHAARRQPATRRLMYAYRSLLAGDVSFNMVATKPWGRKRPVAPGR
jgi:SAM-dependent methyltransferase